MEVNFNTYNDPALDFGSQVTEVEKVNKQLADNLLILEKELETHKSTITISKSIQRVLTEHISELYKTAKSEIDRKDRTILELTERRDLFQKRVNANMRRCESKSKEIEAKRRRDDEAESKSTRRHDDSKRCKNKDEQKSSREKDCKEKSTMEIDSRKLEEDTLKVSEEMKQIVPKNEASEAVVTNIKKKAQLKVDNIDNGDILDIMEVSTDLESVGGEKDAYYVGIISDINADLDLYCIDDKPATPSKKEPKVTENDPQKICKRDMKVKLVKIDIPPPKKVDDEGHSQRIKTRIENLSIEEKLRTIEAIQRRVSSNSCTDEAEFEQIKEAVRSMRVEVEMQQASEDNSGEIVEEDLNVREAEEKQKKKNAEYVKKIIADLDKSDQNIKDNLENSDRAKAATDIKKTKVVEKEKKVVVLDDKHLEPLSEENSSKVKVDAIAKKGNVDDKLGICADDNQILLASQSAASKVIDKGPKICILNDVKVKKPEKWSFGNAFESLTTVNIASDVHESNRDGKLGNCNTDRKSMTEKDKKMSIVEKQKKIWIFDGKKYNKQEKGFTENGNKTNTDEREPKGTTTVKSNSKIGNKLYRLFDCEEIINEGPKPPTKSTKIFKPDIKEEKNYSKTKIESKKIANSKTVPNSKHKIQIVSKKLIKPEKSVENVKASKDKECKVELFSEKKLALDIAASSTYKEVKDCSIEDSNKKDPVDEPVKNKKIVNKLGQEKKDHKGESPQKEKPLIGTTAPSTSELPKGCIEESNKVDQDGEPDDKMEEELVKNDTGAPSTSKIPESSIDTEMEQVSSPPVDINQTKIIHHEKVITILNSEDEDENVPLKQIKKKLILKRDQENETAQPLAKKFKFSKEEPILTDDTKKKQGEEPLKSSENILPNAPPMGKMTLKSFENILNKSQIEPPPEKDNSDPVLHLTDDGEIPVLCLDDNNFSSNTSGGPQEKYYDKNLLKLLDAMDETNSASENNLSAFKPIEKEVQQSEAVGLNAHNTSIDSSISFANCLNKVTSTPCVKREVPNDTSTTTNDSANDSSKVTSTKRRRRCVMSIK